MKDLLLEKFSNIEDQIKDIFETAIQHQDCYMSDKTILWCYKYSKIIKELKQRTDETENNDTGST